MSALQSSRFGGLGGERSAAEQSVVTRRLNAIGPCAFQRKTVKAIRSVSGGPIVTYEIAHCACGQALTVRQNGHGRRLRHGGFDATEEIDDARGHFGAKGFLTARLAEPAAREDVVVDAEKPWEPEALAGVLGAPLGAPARPAPTVKRTASAFALSRALRAEVQAAEVEAALEEIADLGADGDL